MVAVPARQQVPFSVRSARAVLRRVGVGQGEGHGVERPATSRRVSPDLNTAAMRDRSSGLDAAGSFASPARELGLLGLYVPQAHLSEIRARRGRPSSLARAGSDQPYSSTLPAPARAVRRWYLGPFAGDFGGFQCRIGQSWRPAVAPVTAAERFLRRGGCHDGNQGAPDSEIGRAGCGVKPLAAVAGPRRTCRAGRVVPADRVAGSADRVRL